MEGKWRCDILNKFNFLSITDHLFGHYLQFSVYNTGSTLGQRLLGIKFDSRFKNKLMILFALESLLPYLWEKICRFHFNSLYFTQVRFTYNV